MAGVRDDLILDISQAQRAIDQLGAQIDAALSGLHVNVDTAGIAQEITAAVDAADTSTVVTADTSGIPGEVSRAVDVADTDVQVDADTSAARAEVRRLDDEIDRTSQSARGLGTVLTGAALVAGVRGLFGLAEAASAVSEQTTGSEIVFGNLADQVQRFADQADRIGLAEAQALQLSNTFGQLALSAGLADQAVVDFATSIVERGADIASLRDIDLAQTLDALRSGLVGETEPLRNIGIFINEAAVAAEAYRSGIAELGEELTDAEKIQARYNLIMRQSDIAAGNFALTSEGLANKQRQVRAGLVDLAADAGQVLEPTFLNLASLTEERLIPGLGRLADEALPSVASILESLAPLLGVTVDLLIAGAPILEVTADILDAIPEPLLAIAAGWIAVNRAQRLVTRASELSAIQRMTTQVRALRTAMAVPISPAVGGAGLVAGLGALVAITNSGAGDDIGAVAGSLVSMADSLTGFGRRREESVGAEVERLIGGLDLTKIDDAQVAFAKLSSELDAIDGQVGKGRLFSLGSVDIFATTGDAKRNERIEQLREQIELLEKEANAEIQAGLDTGRFTQAQVNAAQAQAERERSAAPLIRQVEILRREEEAAAREAERVIDRYASLAAQYVDTGAAAERLRDTAPQVESALSRIRLGVGGSDEDFLGLALAIDDASLSAEGMQDVAALLGTDVDKLTGFVDTATSAFDRFVDQAVSGIPTITDVWDQALTDAEDSAARAGEAARTEADKRAQAIVDAAAARISDAGDGLGQAEADAIRDEADKRAQAIRDGADVEAAAIEDAARVTAAGLTRSLEEEAAALADFRQDLDALRQGGYTDLAGILAGQGLELGDALADELSDALAAGNVEILDGLRTANETFEAESQATVDFIRDDLGPELLSVTGLLGSAISENFGSELDFEEKVRIAGELAKTQLDAEGRQIAAIAAVEGEDAARAYGEALGLDQAVIDEGVKAGKVIMGLPVTDFANGGRRIGQEIATGIVGGFEAGLLQGQTAIEEKSAQLVLQAEAAMRRAGQIESPSKLTARLGEYLAEGLVVGLEASSVKVAAAGARTLGSAVPTFGVRAGVTAGGGAGGVDYDRLAAAIAAQMRPNVTFAPTVHNPVAATSEASLRREWRSMQLLARPS